MGGGQSGCSRVQSPQIMSLNQESFRGFKTDSSFELFHLLNPLQIKRRFIPRHADIFMILSTTFTSGDGNFSCFAMNLRTVIRKMLKIDKIFLDDIFYHINSIHQAESGDAPQMQHQGNSNGISEHSFLN